MAVDIRLQPLEPSFSLSPPQIRSLLNWVEHTTDIMKASSIISATTFVAGALTQQPGGQVNSPEALASPGTGRYGEVRTYRLKFRGRTDRSSTFSRNPVSRN